MIEFTGASCFRYRLIIATLTGRAIRFIDLHTLDQEDDDEDKEDDALFADETDTATEGRGDKRKKRQQDGYRVGLKDYEHAFLRLLELVTNGSTITINYTGTEVTYKPGIVHGGALPTFQCPLSRSIGYYLEALVLLSPFAKYPLQLELEGLTSDNRHISADLLRTVILPLLPKFGVEQTTIQIVKRGHQPKGGGLVKFSSEPIRQLRPVQFLEPGQIQKIRGIASCVRMSPSTTMTLIEAARPRLTKHIPDVYIYNDVFKGKESGLSSGYALTLVAESTTGVLLSAEEVAEPLKKSQAAKGEIMTNPTKLALRTVKRLYQQIQQGGCIDTISQPMILLLMAMSSEDVSQVTIGTMEPFTMQVLRDLKKLSGLKFRIQKQAETGLTTLTCSGLGLVNLGKKVI